MAKFCSQLHTVLISDYGTGVFRLTFPLIYRSDVADTVFIVPYGFVTDLASVPRLPVIFFLTGGTAQAAAVIHDWLYSPKCKDKITRKMADDVFYEAMLVCDVPKWRAWLMWMGVRSAGASFFRAE